ncbi:MULTISPECIES: helix-turn-helix domain-containing protein [Enterococcus]|uniref:helix-turn-helix domain-containing protein n=1 Tax=Enterococcus TaxID=1350 RepID=UPI00031CE356|nr:helix-turn-helix domain-containing protein [Enterococcus mundtii]MDB7102431.1 helix-turn-helix domain-containing protein [Enterococcus mundtii]
MREYFFNYKENEIIQFFQYCYINKKDYYPKKSIQEALNISEYRYKAIGHRVEEIKTQYPTFDFNYDKHGLSIRFSKEFLLLKVYILLFKETVGFKFVLSIYKEEFQNLSSFSESVHMHQQSVLPKLKPVRVLLGEHSLEYLLFKKKISGEEYRIRHFFFELFWHLHDEREPIIPEYPESFQALATMIHEYLPMHSREDIRKLYLFMKITQHRMNHGHTITSLPITITEVRSPLITYDVFKQQIQSKEITGRFFKKTLNETELNYLYYVFTVVPTYTYHEKNELPSFRDFYTEEYQELERSIFDQLFQQTKRRLTGPQESFLSLNMIYRVTYFLSYGSDNYVPPYSDLEYFYYSDPTKDHYFKIVDKIISQIPLKEEKWQRIFNSQSFRFSLFQLVSWVLEEQLDSVKVAILTKYGKLHKTELVRYLTKLNPRPIEVVEYDEYPEIIFCDFPLKEGQEINPKAEIYFIGVKPTPLQWLEIVNFVDSFRTKKQFGHLMKE